MASTAKLYANTKNINAATGLPEDYPSLVVIYQSTVNKAAENIGIPLEDRLDSAQEVQTKFWHKNGLDLYDASKGFKFASFYKRWVSLFLLQERDKSLRYNSRHVPYANNTVSTALDSTVKQVENFEHASVSKLFINEWFDNAVEKLNKETPELVPLLTVMVDFVQQGVTPTRNDLADTLNMSVYKVTKQVFELRKVLEHLGIGMESLYGKETAA